MPSDEGLWSQLRGGLAFSLRGLSISASWLIVGLLFVLPWVLVIYAVLWLARRCCAPNLPPLLRHRVTFRLANSVLISLREMLCHLAERDEYNSPAISFGCNTNPKRQRGIPR